MFIEHDEYGNLYDINIDCDLCINCIHSDICVALMMIASGMVTLNNTQPLECCPFYCKNNWFNRLIYRR